MENFDEIWEENLRRNRLRDRLEHFDPVSGEGCSGDRVEVGPEPWTEGRELVPREMLDDPKYPSARDSLAWTRLRCRHDFEYWAAKCCRIKDKNSRRIVPFILNRPQRRVVKLLEADRRAGRPMRMVILKARQWGGSALCYLLIYLESAMNQPNSLLLKMFNTNMTVDYLCTLHYFSISSSLISPIRVVSIWLTHIQASTISHSSS